MPGTSAAERLAAFATLMKPFRTPSAIGRLNEIAMSPSRLKDDVPGKQIGLALLSYFHTGMPIAYAELRRFTPRRA